MVESTSHLKEAGEEMRCIVLRRQHDTGDVEHLFPVAEKLGVEPTALRRALQVHGTDNDFIKVGVVAVKQVKERPVFVEQQVLVASACPLGKTRPQLRDKRLDTRHDVRVIREGCVWLVNTQTPDSLSLNKVRPEGLTFIRDALGQERIAIAEMRRRL